MMDEKDEKHIGFDSQSSQYSGVHEKPTVDAPAPPSKKSSIPTIAGVLLLVAGILALLLWISAITIDVSTMESMVDISQLQKLDPTITPEKIKEFFTICGTVGIILSVFTVLGGILAVKRKLWGIALTCGILGLYGLIIIFPGILSLIGLILIAISRKEFQ
jgi:hypothetical protein